MRNSSTRSWVSTLTTWRTHFVVLNRKNSHQEQRISVQQIGKLRCTSEISWLKSGYGTLQVVSFSMNENLGKFTLHMWKL
ncbi:unnamed protein product, partial [Sphagnum compactum]